MKFKLIAISMMALVAVALALTAKAAPPATKPATKPTTSPTTQALKELTLDLGNKVTMKFVLVPAGQFMMGSPPNEKDRHKDEGPRHEVRISRALFFGVTPVTQGQWKAIMGKGPFEKQQYTQANDDSPASYISWNDAVEFCRKMGAKTGRRVRLPTEAEWEYACRAGTQTRYYYGEDPQAAKLGEYAWYDKNTWDVGKAFPHPVGQKKPNAWGLYDMSGNVNEWCVDWEGPYPNGAVTDPIGPANGKMRVFRGGSFVIDSTYCRCAARNRNQPERRIIDNGLRVVVMPEGAELKK